MRQVEIDPKQFNRTVKGWIHLPLKQKATEQNQTLEQLEHYVDHLKRHHIHNIDDV